MATITTFALFLASLIATSYSQSGFSFDGGDYKCEGAESCFAKTDTQIVSNLICKGHCACCTAVFTFPCGTDKCGIECEEEDSCASMAITMDRVSEVMCGEARSCQASTFMLAAYDGFKFECSDEEACAGAVIVAQLVSSSTEAHMDEFQCDGERTCALAQVALERLEKVSCEGYRSCEYVGMVISNPARDFYVQCEGDSSCQSADFVFSFTADAPDFFIKSIECESPAACQGATFTIDSAASTTVVIDELKCEGFQSCGNLQFVVAAGNVEINKCICEQPWPYTCLCTEGLDAVCNTFEGVWESDSTIYTCA